METEEGSEVQAENEDDSGCSQKSGILRSERSQRTLSEHWRFTESEGLVLPQAAELEKSSRCYLIWEDGKASVQLLSTPTMK